MIKSDGGDEGSQEKANEKETAEDKKQLLVDWSSSEDAAIWDSFS